MPVEHILITGGGHTWPGSAFDNGATNQDINASQLIWEFFDRFDINGLREVSSTQSVAATAFAIFPNPVSETLFIDNINSKDNSYQIHDMSGLQLSHGLIENASIPVYQLDAGMYFVKVGEQIEKFIKL